MRFYNDLIINAQDAAVNITSNPLTLESMYGFSLMAMFTGTVTGTLKLQASCDQGTNVAGTVAGVSNWVDIGGTSTAIAAPQNVLYNIDAAYYKWVRIVYTAGAGAGTLTVRFNAKGV